MSTKKLHVKSILMGTAFTLAAMAGIAQKPVKNINAAITIDRTFSCDTVYFLKGIIYVKNNATLTINPGTVIVGDTTNKGTLVITKGAKIQAVGTPACPIVFTSSKAQNRRKRGDWGGVIILGKATINQAAGVANIEGITPSADTEYGGGIGTSDDNDISGTLKYVRIEFCGVALAPNNEINGLTMGGVGRGTIIDYVQVSFSGDDSFEWFGGTVNCKHLIAFRGIDDDFDTDNGYSGKVQYAMGLRDPLVADVSGSSAFESDNDALGSTNSPQTRAVFCNVTATAGSDSATNPLFRHGAQIRRNSHLFIYNSIIMGFPDGLFIDGTLTNANALADTLVNDNLIACKYSPKYVVSTTSNAGVVALLTSSNTFYPNNKKVKLVKPYLLTNPNYQPKATSPALGAADFDHAALNDAFFDVVTYVGAFDGTNNWAATWANFNPEIGNYYSTPCSCGSLSKTVNTVVDANAGDVNIFPNPANGNFKVDIKNFNGNVNLRVINLMNGSLAYTSKQIVTAQKTLINVNGANLATGFYSVEVSDGNKTVVKKLSITK